VQSIEKDHDTRINLVGKQKDSFRTRDDLKASVQEFCDAASCGEVYASGSTACDRYESQARARYSLEPYFADFAEFHIAPQIALEQVDMLRGATRPVPSVERS
jgi:hypothetical protein